VAEQAVQQTELLTSQMIEKANADPELRDNYLKKLEALEAIPVTVDELVLDDLIYQPRPSQVPY
jgi:hypothetical protein